MVGWPQPAIPGISQLFKEHYFLSLVEAESQEEPEMVLLGQHSLLWATVVFKGLMRCWGLKQEQAACKGDVQKNEEAATHPHPPQKNDLLEIQSGGGSFFTNEQSVKLDTFTGNRSQKQGSVPDEQRQFDSL